MIDTEIAWAAGLWDGEGSTGILSHKKTPHLRYVQMQMGMTDKEPLDRFALAVGIGKVVGPYFFKKFKPVYRWTATGRTAIPVAKKLLPLLSSPKAKQLASALESVGLKACDLP